MTEKIWPGVPPFPVMGGFFRVLSITTMSAAGPEVLWCCVFMVDVPMAVAVIPDQCPYHR